MRKSQAMRNITSFLFFILSFYYPSNLVGQIVINEIFPQTDRVEIKNQGGSTVNIAGYWLCDRPQYDQIGNLNVICGSTNLGAGQILVVETSNISISSNDGEMGLYINSSFSSSNSIRDYVEWGSSGHGRSNVAEAAGIWTDGDFVPAFSNSASIEYGGNGDCSDVWTEQPNNTLCNENANLGGNCPSCQITGAGLTNIQCDDNNTPSNDTDDLITFNLNPSGNDLATSYSVSVSTGTINPLNANYGAPTAFSLNNGSAGNGNVTVTITDNDDPNCTFQVVINDPGSCSDECNLSSSGIGGIICDDNGTNSDPSDDFVTFNLNPTGSNLAASYSVSVSAGTINPTNANYGAPTAFNLNNGSAGSGNVTVTITDNDDPNCTFQVVINDPGTCSDVCNLSSSGIDGIVCDDNGTNSDPTDDFVTFNLDPTGSNLAASYSVSVSAGTINPTNANYGASTAFNLNNGSAGSGDVTVTITDNNSPNCTFQVIVNDPGSCSDVCNLSSSGIDGITCDDNGTNSDPNDDFIMFNLNPTGSNLAASYSVSVSAGTINPVNANYGASTTFNLNNGSSGSGDVTVTITDDNSPNCTFQVIISDPGTCSGTCNISSSGIDGIICNDNGTNSDPSDDIVTFNLNPTGSNLAASYSVSVSAGTINPVNANYGASTTFNLNNGSAGSGDVTVTITDDGSPNCTFQVIVNDPGTCSDTCAIGSSGIEEIICDDNGTDSDPRDDFVMFNLNPTGSNLSTSYSVSVSAGTIDPINANYGVPKTFKLNNGSAGNGDVTVTITDDNDPNCSLQVLIMDPGSCSGDCSLSSSGLSNISCDNNGTGTDMSDDIITFDLDPMGNNLGSSYTIEVDTGMINPSMGNYGAPTNFTLQAGSAGGGNVSITIRDIDNPDCSLTTTINDPGNCSDDIPCEVEGGLISFEGDTITCVSDTVDRFITLNTDGSGPNYLYVLVDKNGNIIFIHPSSFNLKDLDAGEYQIFGLASNEDLGNISTLDEALQKDCIDVSDNAINVKVLNEEECTTSTEDLSSVYAITLFPVPNPSTLHIRIESDRLYSYQMQITDLSGKILLNKKTITQRSTSVDLNQLNGGIYLITFYFPEGSITKKIVKF